MYLVISSNDMRRLSSACRAELMTVLMSRLPVDADSNSGVEPDQLDDQEKGVPVEVAADQAIGMLREVDLTVSQAQQLIDNVNPLFAQKSLKKFATGEQISKSKLFGPDGDYADAKEFGLKVVGAVNRRLRTITKIPNANLFLPDSSNTKIFVSEKTAQALRVVLNVHEPLPVDGFYKRDGNSLVLTPVSAEPDDKLLKRLEAAWVGFDVRPCDVSERTWFESVHTQFSKSGLQLFTGMLDEWDDEKDIVKIHIHPHKPLVEPFQPFYDNFYDTEWLFYGLDADATVLASVGTSLRSALMRK